MNKIILSCIILLALAACNNDPKPLNVPPVDSTKLEPDHSATTGSAAYFGDKITEEGAVSMAEVKTKMADKKQMNVKMEGKIDAVCQKKGCWMDLKAEDGSVMRVTFKDYSFFMPKDAAGKTAVVEGVASVEETSVSQLKEYAHDAGKSKEEIAAITTPKTELVFEANGVIIK